DRHSDGIGGGTGRGVATHPGAGTEADLARPRPRFERGVGIDPFDEEFIVRCDRDGPADVRGDCHVAAIRRAPGLSRSGAAGDASRPPPRAPPRVTRADREAAEDTSPCLTGSPRSAGGWRA